MTSYPGYPGPDPDDPFSRPPDESGVRAGAAPDQGGAPGAGTEETAPIQGGELGYWERKALEERQASAAPTPGDPAAPDASLPSAPSTPSTSSTSSTSPTSSNPWGGYGQPAQPAYGAPGQPAYGGPGLPGQQPWGQPGQPAYGYGYAMPPNHPSAMTAQWLGIAGLVGGFLCCIGFLISPFAWATGARAKREIAASNGQLGGAGGAQTGYVTGIIGTVILGLIVLGIIGLIVLGLATGSSSPSSTPF